MGLMFGVSSTANSTVSVTVWSDGSGGMTHSFCAMNSFSMSFWKVPRISSRGTPCWSASATYMAKMTGALGLMVKDVETSSKSMPSKRISMSRRVSTATPSLPTSPSDSGSSESLPIRLGMSNAVESPVWPLSMR